MSQVFISYSHKDKDFVQYLAYRLAEQNVEFWVDNDRLYGGVTWPDEINSGLHTSALLILVVTPVSDGVGELRTSPPSPLSVYREGETRHEI